MRLEEALRVSETEKALDNSSITPAARSLFRYVANIPPHYVIIRKGDTIINDVDVRGRLLVDRDDWEPC